MFVCFCNFFSGLCADKQLGEAFRDYSTQLQPVNGTLASYFGAAGEWQASLGEFEFSLQHAVQRVRDEARAVLDAEFVEAKKIERQYEQSRRAFENAERNSEASASDVHEARKALDRDEAAALAQWRHTNDRAQV